MLLAFFKLQPLLSFNKRDFDLKASDTLFYTCFYPEIELSDSLFGWDDRLQFYLDTSLINSSQSFASLIL